MDKIVSECRGGRGVKKKWRPRATTTVWEDWSDGVHAVNLWAVGTPPLQLALPATGGEDTAPPVSAGL